jgi:hypothetical protein
MPDYEHETKINDHTDKGASGTEYTKYHATCSCGWTADEERDERRIAEDDAAMHTMLNDI